MVRLWWNHVHRDSCPAVEPQNPNLRNTPGGSPFQSSKWYNLRVKHGKFSDPASPQLGSSTLTAWLGVTLLYCSFLLLKKSENSLRSLLAIRHGQRQEAGDNLERSLCGCISGFIFIFLLHILLLLLMPNY